MTAIEASSGTTAGPGQSIRWWRERRRLTQLDLSTLADVSSRHISFIETGRSTPTSAMILRLAQCLDIPLREQNSILLSAGFAPAYTQRQLSEPPLSIINDAIDRILGGHAPYPALAVDRQWHLVAANDAIYALVAGAALWLLEPPVNVLRLTLHPDGMAPRIANLPEWRAHILSRLQHDYKTTADAYVGNLLEELRAYPMPSPDDSRLTTPDDARPGHTDDALATQPSLVVPLRLRTDDGVISLFSMTTVFGTPTDVTVSELAVETFYPEDDVSAAYFQHQMLSVT